MSDDEELAAIQERDAKAQCVFPSCHRTAADRRILLARLRSLEAENTALREALDTSEKDFVTAMGWRSSHEPRD